MLAANSTFVYPARGYRARASLRRRRGLVLGAAPTPPTLGFQACVEALDVFAPFVHCQAFAPLVAGDALAAAIAVGGVFAGGCEAADAFVPQSPSQGNCPHA